MIKTIFHGVGLIEPGLYSFCIEQVHSYFGSMFFIEPMTTEEVGQMMGGN